MSQQKNPSMHDRYARAFARTAPQVTEETAGLFVDGYWIDASRYFFVGEAHDPMLGIVNTPSVVDRRSGEVSALVTHEKVAGLISSHLGKQIDPAIVAHARFDWAGEGLVGLSVLGANYVIDSRDQRLASVEPAMEQPALYSPDGKYACFVRGHDLWVRDRATRDERPLTTDGAANRYYGQTPEASWARIPAGHGAPCGRWSPDSQWFLTHLIDDSELPDLPVVEHAPKDGGRPRLHTYRYCIWGDPKPKLHFVAIHVGSGRIVRFENGSAEIVFYSPFHYILRSAWFETSRIAWFIRFDRHIQRAELVRLDLQQGTATVVFVEQASGGYLSFNPSFADRPNVWTLSGSDELIWYSERDGWGHLYLHEASTGKVKAQITRGKWVVRRIIDVDEKARKVIFSAHGVDAAVDPAHRSVCSANFDGSGFEILLRHEGDLYVPPRSIDGAPQESPFRDTRACGGFSPDREFAIAQFWSVDRGNSTELVDLSSRKRNRGQVVAAALPRAHENVPRPFTAIAADGVTPLYGVMFVPPDLDEQRSYPLVDFIYGCAGVAQAPQSYLDVRSSHCRALAELGFVSIMLDTRGVVYRDRTFNQAGYGSFFEPQLADHAAVIRQLCKRHEFIDENRVGIFGESYGGMTTARAMFDYGDLFKVGVSVCGCHDLSQFLTFQADWSLGPASADRVDLQSNVDVAHKLQGKLLLMHGELDARVPASHTLSLAAALIRSNRDFDLLILPDRDHGALSTFGYAQRRMWDYFVQHLLREAPAKNFEADFSPRALERSLHQALFEIL